MDPAVFSDANNVKQQLPDRFATGAVISPTVSRYFIHRIS